MNRLASFTKVGEIYDGMGSYPNYHELASSNCVPWSDAVAYFAAIARLLKTSDNECCKVNTVGTSKVIGGAVEIGGAKSVLASSKTTYGTCFAMGN